MKAIHLFFMGLLVSLTVNAAWAQDDWSSDSTGDDSSFGSDDSGSTGASTSIGTTTIHADVDAASGARSYPSFSLAAKVELMNASYQGIGLITMSHPVLLDFSFDIISRLSIFAVFGTYLALSHEETSDYEEKTNQGILLLGGGVRFNFMEPRAGHAHLYLAADLMGGIGVASVKLNGDDDSDEEKDAKDAAREEADHILFGAALGIEYLVISEFGIGAEVALRYYFNRLEDTAPDVNFDKYYVGFMVTSFGLRIAYHF
jgi:hypothetical protein